MMFVVCILGVQAQAGTSYPGTEGAPISPQQPPRPFSASQRNGWSCTPAILWRSIQPVWLSWTAEPSSLLYPNLELVLDTSVEFVVHYPSCYQYVDVSWNWNRLLTSGLSSFKALTQHDFYGCFHKPCFKSSLLLCHLHSALKQRLCTETWFSGMPSVCYLGVTFFNLSVVVDVVNTKPSVCHVWFTFLC